MNTKKKDPRFLRNNNVIAGLTKDVYDKIDKLAEEKHLSKSKLVEVFIREYLEREGF